MLLLLLLQLHSCRPPHSLLILRFALLCIHLALQQLLLLLLLLLLQQQWPVQLFTPRGVRRCCSCTRLCCCCFYCNCIEALQQDKP